MEEPKPDGLWVKIRGKVGSFFQKTKETLLISRQKYFPKSRDYLISLWKRLGAWASQQSWFGFFSQKGQALQDKFSELKKSETFQSQQKKLLAQKESLEKKAKALSEKAIPLTERTKELAQHSGPLKEKAQVFGKGLKKNFDLGKKKLSASFQQGETTEEGETRTFRSGLPQWLERTLLRLVRIPWLGKTVDWWLNLRFWKSERTFFRVLLPTLALSCLLLLTAGVCIQVYVRSSLANTEQVIRTEATQSMLGDIHARYGGYLEERAEQLSTIVLDNVAKGALVADAPTFQDLNIQKMEEFSRSLLRKDSNLLNVVVLTKEEVKQAVRTRRIGDTTRFLFTCCELPDERQISYQEIDEQQWLQNMGDRKQGISDLYMSPVNGETYFYLGANIEDFKGSQNGALLLRYNLNFAIRILQNPHVGGINYLVANDSVLVASSLDSLMPKIEVAQRGAKSAGEKVDYIFAVIELIRRSATQEEALVALRKGNFIEDPRAFSQQFQRILPGTLPLRRDTAVNATLLTEEQAEAILSLSFGQLLGLKRADHHSPGGSVNLNPEESRILALAYLDSIKSLGTGYIVDENYLLTFATNEFGWLIINQASNEQYLAPVEAKNQFLTDRFETINSKLFWFIFLAGLFFLALFVFLITGILYQFTMPVKRLADWVAKNRINSERLPVPDNEMAYLEESFARMNDDLQDYVEQLENSNRDLEQYAHVVAHDLREPLRMIGSYVNLLVKKHQKDFDEDSETYAQFAIDGTQRMDLMIRRILEYASLTRNLSQEPVIEVDLNLAVQEAQDNLHNYIEELDAKITIQDLPKVHCKANFMVNVFQNLIENALKYRLEEGAVEIEIVSVLEQGDYQISIKDNGKGIAAEMQENVFSMFSRVGAKSEPNGLGIGLASTRRIIEHNGGKIWVNSEGENKGSTFFFTLPSKKEA